MTKLFRGLYRTTAGAYVADDAMAFNVPEAEYRAFGYEPDYDSLPWKESYVAAKAAVHGARASSFSLGPRHFLPAVSRPIFGRRSARGLGYLSHACS